MGYNLGILHENTIKTIAKKIAKKKIVVNSAFVCKNTK